MSKVLRRCVRAMRFAALGFALASCDGPGASPFMLFTYAGYVSGTFNASGPAPSQGAEPASGVSGVRDVDAGIVALVGAFLKTGGEVDLAIVAFPIGASGTLALSDCDPATASCGAVVFITEKGTGLSAINTFCTLTDGTLTLTGLAETHASGTFSGTGACVDGEGVDLGTFTVTNGSFSVPLTAATPVE